METQEKPKVLDLDAIRAKLSGKSGKQYWRGLEEIAETDEFQAWVDDEFPNRKSLQGIDRRSLLKFMGASMALAGLSGCRGFFLPEEKLVPYVKNPEELTIGKPLYYASVFTHAGYGHGVLVEQHEGRATKIEGNPDHPESQGASSPIIQASILSLYDPDRSGDTLSTGDISTYDEFLKALNGALAARKAAGGSGLRLLTGSITSPTMLEQIGELQAQYPQMVWHAYEPFGRDSMHDGSKMAFGQPLDAQYDLKSAKVVLSLDADFFVEGPGALKYSRDFASARRVSGSKTEMNRLYAVESTPTLAGAMADHRWPVKPSQVHQFAASILAAVSGSAATTPVIPQPHFDAVVKDLLANKGACVVIPGEYASPEIHAIAAAINAALGNDGKTVSYTKPVDGSTQARSIDDLVAALNSGKVEVLITIGSNPVFTAPSDLNFADAFGKAKLKIHHGYYVDETAKLCDWHVPSTHFLEEWGDARSFDGTVSICQPVTKPLFNGVSSVEFMAALLGVATSGRDRVRQTWQKRGIDDPAWRTILHNGMVPNSAAQPLQAAVAAFTAPPAPNSKGTEVVFRPDPQIFDGRYANNGWLQELPRPLTKITWDNAAIMSPATVASFGAQSEDQVEVTLGGPSQTFGVWAQPGMPDDVLLLHCGFGRPAGGTVAEGAGVNAYSHRTSKTMLSTDGVEIKKVGGVYPIATTQLHHSMSGWDIVRHYTLKEYEHEVLKPKADGAGEAGHSEGEERKLEDLSMYPDEIFSYDGPQWGMTIDLNVCIGCNACSTACQAENNIPIVGKDQVKRGREMHWIRIDRYFTSTNASTMDGPKEDPEGQRDPIANPMTLFQPVMCVQCEKAPCEPVCPVAATVHSHEGLNQMVYNRCVGTRYCSNNCPYKVRRFNYLNYSDNQPQFTDYADLLVTKGRPPAWAPGPIKKPKENGIELLRMLNNPEVTVRGRGVMEKCTYCVQRISAARIEAKKLGRDPIEGEIVTACQQACPTQAITFGNIADPNSAVSKMRKDPRAYKLLEELQTRPRTSHLGKICNPNPEIKA